MKKKKKKEKRRGRALQANAVLNSNAFIFPTVYFFFPETAYRSLEEMDAIFAKSNWLSVVSVAAKEPHRYDKHGNLVIAYEDTEEGKYRRSSVRSLDKEGAEAEP